MSDKVELAVGDWIRFLRPEGLVIAEVEYLIQRSSRYQRRPEAVTRYGHVTVDQVYEVRTFEARKL